MLVELVHVGHEVLDDVHVRQGVDLDRLVARLNFAGKRFISDRTYKFFSTCRIKEHVPDASQGVDPADVHRARSADALPARPPERDCRVHLVLDLDERVENHGTAGVQVDVELLHARLVPRSVGVPSVDEELLVLGRADASHRGRRVWGRSGGGRSRGRGRRRCATDLLRGQMRNLRMSSTWRTKRIGMVAMLDIILSQIGELTMVLKAQAPREGAPLNIVGPRLAMINRRLNTDGGSPSGQSST